VPTKPQFAKVWSVFVLIFSGLPEEQHAQTIDILIYEQIFRNPKIQKFKNPKNSKKIGRNKNKILPTTPPGPNNSSWSLTFFAQLLKKLTPFTLLHPTYTQR